MSLGFAAGVRQSWATADQNIVVVVRGDGFEWQGQKYKSLTAVAKAVTGKHWNGFNFFRVDEGKA